MNFTHLVFFEFFDGAGTAVVLVAGPYCVQARGVHTAGSVAQDLHVAGPSKQDTHTPYAVASQATCCGD